MTSTATQPTLEEQVQALKETAARLAAERDAAMQMASQATKDLVQARREHDARTQVYDTLTGSLRISLDEKNAEIRRRDARIRELAATCEEQQRQIDCAQQEPRPVRQSWWSRRIGNQL